MSNIVTLAHYSNNNEAATNPLYKGVTTVWLLSTLGSSRLGGNGSDSNSSFSSVLKKKDIVNVSIPKTCKVIQNNELELPLRYVSNLLYGVTVCYHRKAEYVLSDVTSLLTQLQKKFYVAPFQRKKNDKSHHVATIFDVNDASAANGLLNDDPLFDINQINNFANVFEPGKQQATTEALSIRRQDFMNELTNSNNFDDAKNLTNSSDRINRPLTLEDIPIDVDFNFDIDDVISQQGTSYHSKTSSQRGDNDFQIDYNKQEFNLNFEGNEDAQVPADETGIDLGIEDDDASFEDEEANTKEGMPPLKKLKVSGSSANSYQLIQIDERTGLSTDILRSNHDHYFEIMDSKRRKKRKNSTTINSSWQTIMRLDEEANFVQRCWNLAFANPGKSDLSFLTSKEPISDYRSIERGRKRARSLQSERSSSSISSEEQGRRAVLTRDGSLEPDNNLLLNLEQINEELDEDESTNRSDLLQINLDLPPSSFGRTDTRDNVTGSDSRGASFAQGLDVVDELRQVKSRRRKGGDTSTIVSDSSDSGSDHLSYQVERHSLGSMVLDSHTRKFYDYIKERSSYVGKTTRSNPPFQKKMLFEDVVPSSLSLSGTGTDSQNVSVTDKKIAASAFLSLLNLASKDLIDIKGYHDHEESDRGFKPFELMNGDDIVVYA